MWGIQCVVQQACSVWFVSSLPLRVELMQYAELPRLRRMTCLVTVTTATHVQCLCEAAQEAIDLDVSTRHFLYHLLYHFLRSHTGSIILRTQLPALTAYYNVSLVIILSRVVGHTLLSDCSISVCSCVVQRLRLQFLMNESQIFKLWTVNRLWPPSIGPVL